MGNLDSNELYHHGILGMKWGVRRYQNKDGTLTEAGKKRYQNWDGTPTKEGKKLYSIPHWKKGYVPPEKRAYDENGKLTPAGQDGKEVFDDLMRKYYPDEKSIRNEETRRQKYDEQYHKWYFNEDSSKSAILKKKLRELDADDKMDTIIHEAKEILKEKGSILVPEKGNYRDIADVMLRLHEDSFSDRTKFPEQKKASLDRAAKNDSWELNFLETVQNDPVLQKGGKELLNEYSKYLDNPRKYMHEFKSSEYANKTNPMNAVKKVFDNSSKDPKDFNKIYQKAMEEAEKSDPDFYDRKLDDVMDAYLLDLFDQEATKKAKHCDFSEDFLEHWGILGMKWGVRRYQNKDGSLTSAGRKRYASGKNVGFFEARRLKKKRAEAAKKRQATLEAKRKSEEDAQKHEAEKQEAIRSGNATQIAKFQNELSNQELRDALDRLNSKQRLSDLVDKETPKKETKLDKAMKIADKGAKYADIAEKGIKVYNTFAKVSNAFADDDSQLPIIGEKREKKEAKEAKDPKKEAAIRSGDPEQLKKWQGKLTPEEVKTAKLTVDYWNSINDKTVSNTKKEQESGKKTAHSVLDQIANSNSQYDPNEHQNTLWRNNFNPIEDRRKERAAQDKRIEELIKKYSK